MYQNQHNNVTASGVYKIKIHFPPNRLTMLFTQEILLTDQNSLLTFKYSFRSINKSVLLKNQIWVI